VTRHGRRLCAGAQLCVALDAKLIHFLAGKPSTNCDKYATATCSSKPMQRSGFRSQGRRIVYLGTLNRRIARILSHSNAKRERSLPQRRDNVKLQFDRITAKSARETDSLDRAGLRADCPRPVASVPERAEPSLGEIALPTC